MSQLFTLGGQSVGASVPFVGTFLMEVTSLNLLQFIFYFRCTHQTNMDSGCGQIRPLTKAYSRPQERC